MSITIRLAVASDAPIVAEFNRAIALETEGLALDSSRLLRGVEALLSDPTKGLYYVAEIGGKITGQLMITYEWSDWRNATFWWIQSVYVHPDFRKQGIFSALYKHIHALAQQRGDVCGIRLYVEEENARAQATYKALGMHHSHYKMMEIGL